MCQNIDSICKKKKSSYTHHQWWWISIYYSQTKKTRPILDTPKKETYCFLANEFTLGDAATNRNVTPNLAFIQIFTGQIHFSNDAHQRTPWWCWRWWHFDNHLTKPPSPKPLARLILVGQRKPKECDFPMWRTASAIKAVENIYIYIYTHRFNIFNLDDCTQYLGYLKLFDFKHHKLS